MTTMQELTGTECPTEILQLINLLVTQKSNIDLSNLSQTGQGILDGKASINLDNLSSLGQAILDKKVEVEALLQQNGYAKFSWKENNQISNLILQWTYVQESNNENDYKYFPIAFTESFLCGTACTNQSVTRTIDYAWLNNEDFSLIKYRVGKGNDWINGNNQPIFILVIGT